MDITRRSFLGGVLSLAAVTVAAKYQFAKPRLWADGVNFDSDAIDAMIAGEPFVTDKPEVIRNSEVGNWRLENGILRISRGIKAKGHCYIDRCLFLSSDDKRDHFLTFEAKGPDDKLHVTYCTFIHEKHHLSRMGNDAYQGLFQENLVRLT